MSEHAAVCMNMFDFSKYLSFCCSRMTIYNETHLYWEQVEADLSQSPAVTGEVIDSFWLIQHNHGSFSG